MIEVTLWYKNEGPLPIRTICEKVQPLLVEQQQLYLPRYLEENRENPWIAIKSSVEELPSKEHLRSLREVFAHVRIVYTPVPLGTVKAALEFLNSVPEECHLAIGYRDAGPGSVTAYPYMAVSMREGDE